MNLIIGHRGTGKTSWLKVIEALYRKKGREAVCLDLDREMERASGKTVSQLFLKGEKLFREWEQKTFQRIAQDKSLSGKTVFIALGAGFQFKEKPPGHVIWLRRPTDSSGRIFFNRPALDPKASPFEEYKSLHKKRDAYYQSLADEVFCRQEHFTEAQLSDSLFLSLARCPRGFFALRLNPKDLPKESARRERFLRKRRERGIRLFELHDESANAGFIEEMRKILPEDNLLFSSQNSRFFCGIKNKQAWSWDLSLGDPPKGVSILALHNREHGHLKADLEKLSSYKNRRLKLAVEIFNLRELKEAYNWQREDPKKRSFLPRSPDGRWRWFRAAFGPRMPLHFIRERESAYLDQPFFSEAIHFAGAALSQKTSKLENAAGKKRALAAVIGNPIDFSATPSEQNDFFYRRRGIPILPLPLKEEEITKENLSILRQLGFVFFAVTSPLKRQAFLCSDKAEESAKRAGAANTLILRQNKWLACNTDIEGLSLLTRLEREKPKPDEKTAFQNIAVWGGGGVKPVLREFLPSARFYSARTGKILRSLPFKREFLKEDSKAKSASKSKLAEKSVAKQDMIKKGLEKTAAVDILVWAVGRKRMEQGCLWPPAHWDPRRIIDLNYSEDSPGREYALKTEGEYQSGWAFFKKQAAKQRELFSRLYEKGARQEDKKQ